MTLGFVAYLRLLPALGRQRRSSNIHSSLVTTWSRIQRQRLFRDHVVCYKYGRGTSGTTCSFHPVGNDPRCWVSYGEVWVKDGSSSSSLIQISIGMSICYGLPHGGNVLSTWILQSGDSVRLVLESHLLDKYLQVIASAQDVKMALVNTTC